MKMKKADVGVAIYIMAAIIMFIVPIPAWLLDILLAVNISIALTVLFATMFSKKCWICRSSPPCCCLQQFSE